LTTGGEKVVKMYDRGDQVKPFSKEKAQKGSKELASPQDD